VVIGAPLVVKDHALEPSADAQQLHDTIAAFVRRVKGA
jgi:hypothetical protein